MPDKTWRKGEQHLDHRVRPGELLIEIGLEIFRPVTSGDYLGYVDPFISLGGEANSVEMILGTGGLEPPMASIALRSYVQ